MVEELVRIVCQVDFAHRHQEMAVAAEPGDVGPIEGDDEILGGFGSHLIARRGVELGVEIEKPFVGLGLAVAIQVEADQAEVKRQLDVRASRPWRGLPRPRRGRSVHRSKRARRSA